MSVRDQSLLLAWGAGSMNLKGDDMIFRGNVWGGENFMTKSFKFFVKGQSDKKRQEKGKELDQAKTVTSALNHITAFYFRET